MFAALQHFPYSAGLTLLGQALFGRADTLWPHGVVENPLRLVFGCLMSLALIDPFRKRRDLFPKIAFSLCPFSVLICGISYAFGSEGVWDPEALQDGAAQLLAALLSLHTAIILWPSMRKISAMPGGMEYRQMTERLAEEVAERKKAQSALKRRQNQLRLIINKLPVSIVYFDKDLHCQYCNATYAKWIGKTKDQIIGQPMSEMQTDQVLMPTGPVIQQALLGETVRSEARIQMMDGLRHVSVEDIPDVDDEGQVNGVIRLMTDVSEHVEIETELKRAKDAADTANIAKSAFVANISHEIRTPLGAVLGFSDMLARDGLSPVERHSYIEAIQRNSELLLHIIDDILDISKMEAERMRIYEEEVDLHEIMRDVENFLKQQAHSKGLHAEVIAEPPLPRFIRTDPYRLKQIILNLLGNAVKFSDQGTVEFRVHCPDPVDKPRQLGFTVTDQGIGIALEYQTHLFESFFQADPSAKRRHGGTGLGLTLSKRFAKLLGGELQLVRSEPGKGTCFLLTIDPSEVRGDYFADIRPATERISPAAAVLFFPNGTYLKGAKILLAEDAPDNQFLISCYLASAGAEVQTASNGKEALEMLATNDVDVVLMDLQMPIMSGFEALRELRKRKRRIPIIALTAHTMRDDRQQCLDAGFDNHIGKPVNRNELIEKISQYLPHAQTPGGL